MTTFRTMLIASSLYTGYSYGVAPMLSYYYGEQNHEKLKKLVAVSTRVIAGISLVTVAASLLLTRRLFWHFQGHFKVQEEVWLSFSLIWNKRRYNHEK